MRNSLQKACAAVLVFGLTTACSDDPVSQNAGNGTAPAVVGNLAATADRNEGRGDRWQTSYIAMLDDCDPDDPAWAPTGGCFLKRGDVNFAEFNLLLASPLSESTVGHPAWRNEPSYVKVAQGKSVRVENEGGRVHTFTLVANFGGGRVPPLNIGLGPAPECLNSASDILPGEGIRLKDLPVGTHRFECCIHPWMRAVIKVLPDDHAGH